MNEMVWLAACAGILVATVAYPWEAWVEPGGVPGVPWHTQTLRDQLNLSLPIMLEPVRKENSLQRKRIAPQKAQMILTH
jgi:hypothetical protein